MTSVGAERWIKSRGLKCYVRGDGGGKVLDTKYHPLKPKILRRRRFMKAAPGVAAVQKEERGTNTVHFTVQQFPPLTRHCITQLWPSVIDYQLLINT